MKEKDKNEITFKVLKNRLSFEGEGYTEQVERCEQQNKMVSQIQKTLRQWWKTQTEKNFILVCEMGGGPKGKWSVWVNLVQLNLSQEEKDAFKDGATKIVEGFQVTPHLV